MLFMQSVPKACMQTEQNINLQDANYAPDAAWCVKRPVVPLLQNASLQVQLYRLNMLLGHKQMSSEEQHLPKILYL